MKHMQRKCSFISWRDKIEDIQFKLEREERMTIDQLSILLEDGVDKGFLKKQGDYIFVPLSEVKDEDEGIKG